MSSIPLFLLFLSLVCAVQALSPSSMESGVSRRGMLQQGASSAAAVVAASAGFLPSVASATATAEQKPKLTNLSNAELSKIITEDVTTRQFLASADLTREIYDESAMFTDEIDTYTLDKWIKGTKKLFVPSKSEVTLIPDTLKVTDSEASFRFSEYLCFNIPFKPVVYLSGTLILKRDTSTGLITSYQEKWDQDVNTVLKSAKFG
ncbi:unnamed protein product [Cylindrotheca closterium]|uniref:PS II complex 12 kDa extrinsic protein n=1 Tax=Cylindrotheca closterium TaxID=2856 RepID=A0AAD2JNE6_9STRA|nr:unnamed protein product [Cylindrotheca closterium]